jgi:hypothetical protein
MKNKELKSKLSRVGSSIERAKTSVQDLLADLGRDEFLNQHNNITEILDDVKDRIELCLKDTNKKKDEGQPEGYPWKSEALGYKTALECIKRTKEKFALRENSEGDVK